MKALSIILFAVVLAFAQPKLSRKDVLGPVRTTVLPEFQTSNSSYKSPKTAFFASLLLPGAGQAYIGGGLGWTKAVLFFAAEAGLAYGAWDSHERVEDARQKAIALKNTQYSLKQNEINLRDFLDKTEILGEIEEKYRSKYKSFRDRFCLSLYNDDQTHMQACKDMGGTSFDSHVRNLGNPKVPSNQDEYDRLIEEVEAVMGWQDFIESPEPLKVAESLHFGTSVSQKQYTDFRNDATEMLERRNLYLGLLVVNHILAALDAGWSAHRNNQRLYQKQVQKINMHIDPSYALQGGLKMELSWVF